MLPKANKFGDDKEDDAASYRRASAVAAKKA